MKKKTCMLVCVNLVVSAVLTGASFAKPAPIPKSAAPEWSPIPGKAEGTDERLNENGKTFLRIITEREKMSYFIQNDKVYNSIPGSPWTLRFCARSAIPARSGVRAGVFFYDESGKRLREGDGLMHCGGETEWKEYTYNFTPQLNILDSI